MNDPAWWHESRCATSWISLWFKGDAANGVSVLASGGLGDHFRLLESIWQYLLISHLPGCSLAQPISRKACWHGWHSLTVTLPWTEKYEGTALPRDPWGTLFVQFSVLFRDVVSYFVWKLRTFVPPGPWTVSIVFVEKEICTLCKVKVCVYIFIWFL